MRITNVYAHRVAIATVGAVVVLGAAACGGGAEAPAPPESAAPREQQSAPEGPPAGAPDPAQLQELTSCFEENGVTLPEAGTVPEGAPQDGPPQDGPPPAQGGAPDLDQAPPGVDEEAWAAAVEACGDLVPAPPQAAPSS